MATETVDWITFEQLVRNQLSIEQQMLEKREADLKAATANYEQASVAIRRSERRLAEIGESLRQKIAHRGRDNFAPSESRRALLLTLQQSFAGFVGRAKMTGLNQQVVKELEKIDIFLSENVDGR